MKVTELMIGDWVLHCNRPCKVLGIKDIHKRHDAILLFGQDGFNRKGVEYIPLTAEILEKNGWVFMEGQNYSTFPVPSKWTYQFVPFALRVNGETYSIANTFTVKYVHELQHALRLCGLNELADNFKV